MTRPIVGGGGYDGTYDITQTIKNLSDQVQQQGQATSTEIDDDGTIISIGDNSTYSQLNVIVSDTEPTTLNASTDVGTIWYNTGVVPTTIHWWDGFGFQAYTPGQIYQGGIGLEALGPAVVSRVQTNLRIYYQASAPGSPITNWLYKNNSSNVLQRYNGTTWVTITDANITAAVTYALTATGVDLTDNYITVYYQDAPPTGQVTTDVGNLWYDKNDSYADYTWDGTAWVSYEGDIRLVPLPAGTDGYPPPYSPVPSILAGFGTYFVTWDEVPNTDTTVYDVYASTVNPVVANTGNFLGSTLGTFFFTNMTPAGIAYAEGSTWYFAIMARDPDGLAALSASVSGGILKQKIVRTQITDNAIDTPQLNANAVTASIVASNAVYTLALQADSVKAASIDATGAITTKHTLTGPIVQTASGGQRVVMRNDGSGGIVEFFAGIVGETAGYIDAYTYLGQPGIEMKSGTVSGSVAAYIDLDPSSGVGISGIEILAKANNGNGSFYATGNGSYLDGTTVYIGNGLGFTTSTNIYIGGASTTTTIGGSLSATMGTGSVGTGSFRTSVDDRVVAKCNAGFNGGFIISGGGINVQAGGLVVGGEVDFNSLADGGSNDTASGPKYCRVGGGGVLYASATAPSSRTVKHDINNVEMDYRQILKLRPKSYRYNEAPDTVRAGFIAEEAEELGLGLWVGYEDNDDPSKPTGFDYDGYCAALQIVCQEQQKQIDELLAWKALQS